MKTVFGLLLASLIFLTIAGEAQKAQWRGPDRSGIFPEKGLLQAWPETGPEMILKVDDLGKGYSTPVLVDNTIYLTGKEGDDDYLYAISLQGELLYKVKYGRSWENSYPETRSTPTIEDERLYVISGMGEVVCINKTNGKINWNVNAYEKYDGELHRWGVAESPLVVDDKVIYTNGGEKASVIAFYKLTGEEIWTTESVGGSRTYVSPVVYEGGEVKQIVAATAQYVIGINPGNGNIDWKYYFLREPKEGERQVDISPNSAIIKGDEVFIAKGYNSYGVMLKIAEDGKRVEEKWRTEVLDTHHGHYVNIGGYIYGSNWINNSQGNWVCLNWDDGQVMYEEKWNTKGPIAYADGKLYLWEERTGNFALVNPTPQKFDMISSFRITDGSGPYWAHPYIKDGKLLLRHGEVLMVFNIKA